MIFACCNALGKNELKLPLIGKSEKTYASKNTAPTALPGWV
jgi:hypothetical protein